MMKRRLSNREWAMLAILFLLLLGALYYLLVWMPTANSVMEYELQIIAVEDEITAEQARAQKLAQMRADLERVMGSGNRAEIPDYDNVQNVVRELNRVLAAAEEYNLTFNSVSFEGQLARRVIKMSFTCADFASAYNIIDRLYACQYRCQIGDLSMSAIRPEAVRMEIGGVGASVTRRADIAADRVSVQMDITFYEASDTQA